MSVDRSQHLMLSRRRLLRMGGLSALAGAAWLCWPLALSAEEAWRRLDVVRDLVGDRRPLTNGIMLDLPEVSEDAGSVPLTVRVDSPMTDDDHVRRLWIFAEGNPNPEVAVFSLSPLAGLAEVSTRVRLNETQSVIAVAESIRGDIRLATRHVRVTESGCFMRNPHAVGARMGQARVAVPRSFAAGKPGEVRTLITHPMETGLREDDDGNIIPRHIVTDFRAELEGEMVLESSLHTGISANPYFRFFVRPAADGELVFAWVDDTGERAEERARVVLEEAP